MPTVSRKCLVPDCKREAAMGLKRGLCMICHSAAKKLIDLGSTNWDELVRKGLALEVDDGLFVSEFNKRTEAV